MRVCVITPFHRPRPEWLAQCHASVRAQTHPCTHLLVGDGKDAHGLDDFQGQFIALGQAHRDCGDTPRAIGALSAAAQGFDAIAWLDDDNWFHPQHIETLVELHQKSGEAICSSTRDIHHLDGRRLGRCPEIDGKHFVDTNCFLLTRRAFALIGVWTFMPPAYHQVGDMYLCATIRAQGMNIAHSGLATVCYRATRSAVYDHFGLPRPEGVRDVREVLRELEASGIRVLKVPGTTTPYIEL